MSKHHFRAHRFSPDAARLLQQCIEIIEGYMQQGLRLTLRQTYYQCVVRNLFPNSEKSYKRLSALLSDARLAGLVDWEAIEDRVRVPVVPQEFRDLKELAEVALNAYRLPRWADQECYVECWTEKDAISGVLRPIAREFHVTMMVNRGYCVSPDTRILTADLRWIKAGDVAPGLEILGPDEEVPGYRKHRKLRITPVKSVQKFISPRVQVTTDHGTLTVSANHPFLVTHKTRDGNNWHGYRWAFAACLRKGERIARVCDPWKEDKSWESGWLSGVYDGEGCLPLTRLNTEVDVYQKPGAVCNKIKELLRKYGWIGTETHSKKTKVVTFRTYGVDRVLCLLGTLRPIRLLLTFRKDVQRRGWPAKSKTPATVISVKYLGLGPVVGIETGTRTLVTEGLISHNSSQSAMYDSASRFMAASDAGKECKLFYLGDHDPSGEDMVRDIRDRLEMFGAAVEVEKIGLTMAQVERYNPPPNPAKLSDPRSAEYVDKHGAVSWEVDALPPEVLNRLVRGSITGILDVKKMDVIKRREEADKRRLLAAVREIVGDKKS